MPGQTVNALTIPIQRSLRKRSASLSSMRAGDFMTMNPREKYTTPRPAPNASLAPLPASAHLLRHQSSSRSLSPSPSWRRFFRRSPDRASTPTPEVEVEVSVPEDDARSVRSYASGTRSRDISPESLRRFLRDDSPEPAGEGPAVMVIPEDVEEDGEGEDDENFASAGPEGVFPTGLAPPPFKRAISPSPLRAFARGDDDAESPVLPDFERRSRFSFSSVSSCGSEAVSPNTETPVVYGLGQDQAGYRLPTGSSKGEDSVLGGEELRWMVHDLKT
ncbi:hypothetical protein IMZ48_34045 [Candidatus Bathyarchaeota archaeon]|nr:hypothetical protein [Candidatus Bathyarchaeota archaeon]